MTPSRLPCTCDRRHRDMDPDCPRHALAATTTAPVTVPLNPECQQGKHANCDGNAVDDRDDMTTCGCLCHGKDTPT